MRFLAATAVLMSLSVPAQAEDFAGAARAVDGDSLFVAGREVRLFGIDAPEYRQTCRVGWTNWSCGSDAAAALRAMIDARHLTCTPVDRDVYGRTVATCRVEGIDVAAAMLDKGLAITLDTAPADYAALEGRSKARRAGIWNAQFETPATFRAANPRDASAPPPAPIASRAFTRPIAAMRAGGGAFRNCAEARAAGAAPVLRGQAGYGPHLDRDGDGVACEPYRGR